QPCRTLRVRRGTETSKSHWTSTHPKKLILRAGGGKSQNKISPANKMATGACMEFIDLTALLIAPRTSSVFSTDRCVMRTPSSNGLVPQPDGTENQLSSPSSPQWLINSSIGTPNAIGPRKRA